MANFSEPYKNAYYLKRKKLVASRKIASGCVDCGVWGPDEILSFDHVRGGKEFNIGSAWDVSLARLEAEIDKCDVVCHNCHSLRTAHRVKDSEGPVFTPYPKTPRWAKDIVITEKIDGTNGTIWIDGDGGIWAGSRNRWLTVDNDNYGFCAWAMENASSLVEDLGEGCHRGEWWGKGIQRGYGLDHRRFSLFNVSRWEDAQFHTPDVYAVPVLYNGPNEPDSNGLDPVTYGMRQLEYFGSFASPSFLHPEGVIAYHTASRQVYKKTFDDDGGKFAAVKAAV